ncbi:hypothetical protein D3C71_1995070 [compost metagenome]
MPQNKSELPATSITGVWRGTFGGYWSTDGIIIDGTYVMPPPQPEVVTVAFHKATAPGNIL